MCIYIYIQRLVRALTSRAPIYIYIYCQIYKYVHIYIYTASSSCTDISRSCPQKGVQAIYIYNVYIHMYNIYIYT